jgi:protein-L-isoaspartate(D-aspartate) O-methyltransferase
MNASRAPNRGAAPQPARTRLIEDLRRQGINDERVLAAINKVPRHDFIDGALQNRAYENNALPIGHAQTISQPTVVALMSQALTNGKKLARVLEIGTGSGYQTAVLAELVDTVFTVERIKPLTEIARKRLAAQGYKNIHFGYADGSKGWAAYAPYDGIMVTAAADEVPPELLEQLAPNGRLLIPTGPPGAQSLLLLERTARGITRQSIAAVSFVPLLQGRA